MRHRFISADVCRLHGHVRVIQWIRLFNHLNRPRLRLSIRMGGRSNFPPGHDSRTDARRSRARRA